MNPVSWAGGSKDKSVADDNFQKASPLVRAVNAITGPGRIWRGLRLTRQVRQLRRQAGGPIILVDRQGGIGDIINTIPGVLALRAKHPGCQIVYSTRHEFVPIVRMGQCADRIVGRDYQREDPRIKPGDFDLAYWPRLPEELPPADVAPIHAIDIFCAAMDVLPANHQPRLTVDPTLAAAQKSNLLSARRGDGPLIGIHTGPTWPVKQWSAERWEALVRALAAESRPTVFQFGADVDTGSGNARSPRVSGTVDWVNRLSLEESTAAIAALDLFVGIDSGLVHTAAAVGTSVVGIFGPVSAALRLPGPIPGESVAGNVPCLNCHHRLPRLHWRTGCPYNIACMSALEPGTVLEACRRVLAQGRRKLE